MSESIKLHPSWRASLEREFAEPYMGELKSFLLAEREAGKPIFPKGANWFRALDLTPLQDVRVVILGQDPYHGEGQAHGLCFSVPPGVRPPPSLVNIFKEMESDLGFPPARHGFLEHWAKQGVLLLNSVLTVEMGRAGSHRDRGWERFTDAIIQLVNAKPEPVVFMLWGSYAQKKAAFVESRGAAPAAESAPTLRRSPPIAASSAAAIFPRRTPFWKPRACRRSTGRCRKRDQPRKGPAWRPLTSATLRRSPLRPRRRGSTMCPIRGRARFTWCVSPRRSSRHYARSPASPTSRIW